MITPVANAFAITRISIKHTCCELGYPVSRSQARKLCSSFNEFEEIILDLNFIF